jgi:hypothetical protein
MKEKGLYVFSASHAMPRRGLRTQLFPGLKPWAESCSHLRGMNHWEVTPLQMSKLQSAFGALKAPKFFKIALAGRLTGKRHSLLLAISK